jgi:hypothetical protein
MLSDLTWKMLGQSAAGPGGLLGVRLFPESPFNIFAALDQATGHRFLLLKSSLPNLHPKTLLPSGRGFNVAFVTTPGDPEGANCLRFELTDLRHSDVFDVIGNDVLQHLLRASDDVKAFSTFVSRIGEWQHFLDQLPGDGLSEQAQQGLFGELWFLRRFMLPELDPRRAVGAWAGPRALAKDFQLAGLAFEVKASSAKQHTKFNVSSEVQLDPAGVHRLILYGLLLERLVAGGMSLPELVAAVRADLLKSSDTDASIGFSQLLLQSGYTEANAARYTARFAIRSEQFFDVRDDFPRIVDADLRQGVGDVRYSILLSECERYAVAEETVRNLIRATP